jgi:hypothetical protein
VTAGEVTASSLSFSSTVEPGMSKSSGQGVERIWMLPKRRLGSLHVLRPQLVDNQHSGDVTALPAARDSEVAIGMPPATRTISPSVVSSHWTA